MCLGQEDAADLHTPLWASEGNDLLDAAITKDRAQAQGARLRSTGATGGRHCRPHERDRG